LVAGVPGWSRNARIARTDLSRADSSITTGSLKDDCALATQAPAKQSAWSSMTTEGALIPARAWIAWPISCARTTGGAKAPKVLLSWGTRIDAS
jgi:hypothetical protein